jgi:hypothetical protein
LTFAVERAMRERWVRAISRNTLLAAGLSAAMIWRWEVRGWPGRRGLLLIYLVVLLGLTIVAATVWQARSRVERWEWSSTVGAFFLSLVWVAIAVVAAVKVAVALR